MMKKRLLSLIVFSAISSSAYAAPFIGSIDSDPGDGMIAAAGWSGGNADLAWSVVGSGNVWTYDYRWYTESKALSHIVFSVSKTFTQANIFPGTTGGWDLGWFGDQGNSDPGIPGPIYGIKFSGNDTDEYFRIVTDRAPMWSDFYAKDGKDGNDWVYAYNASFGSDPLAYTAGPDPYGYIPVPDTITSSVPEPGTFALFGLGITTLLFIRKKPD